MACKHMELMMEIYQLQIDGGRYFVHEHPESASLWKLGAVRKIAVQDAVMTVVGDQCEYGLEAKDKFGTGAAKKHPSPQLEQKNSACTRICAPLKNYSLTTFKNRPTP